MAVWDAQYVEASREIARHEDRRDEAKHHLQQALGAAEVGVLPDGTKYTWKTQARKERLVPAWTGRVLRRHSSATEKESG